MVFFRDTQFLWGIFSMLLMYLTPVFYPETIIPDRFITVYKLNPLYHYITYFRNVMLYGTLPTFEDNAICILFALAMLGFGITVFRKSQDRFILYM